MRVACYEELDEVARGGCGAPGCSCASQPLDRVFLRAACHVAAPVVFSYEAAGAVASFSCGACSRLVVKVAIAVSAEPAAIAERTACHAAPPSVHYEPARRQVVFSCPQCGGEHAALTVRAAKSTIVQ